MIEGAGIIGVEASIGGLSVVDNTRSHRLFKITGGSNPYTAVEVVLDEGDGSRDATGIYDVAASEKLLYEVNGNTAVAANTVVVGVPNPAGAGFYFNVPAASAVSLTSGMQWISGGLTLNQSSGTQQTVGSATLPSAGTYIVSYQLVGELNTDTAGDSIIAFLNLSTSGDVGGSVTIVVMNQVASVRAAGSSAATVRVTITGSQTVNLKAFRVFSGTVTTSKILSSTDIASLGLSTVGGPAITYVKIA